MMLYRLTLAATAALALAQSPVHAQATPPGSAASPAAAAARPNIAADDRGFVMQAAAGGLAEVKLGEMAQRKGASEAVKRFGAQMVADHSKANDELKQVAAAKGLQPPAALDQKHAAVAARLDKLSGAEFDREYIRAMLDDHRQTVALFERQAAQGRDAELKAFAQKTLPTLRQHLTHAENLKP